MGRKPGNAGKGKSTGATPPVPRRRFGRIILRGRTFYVRYRANGVEVLKSAGPTRKLAEDLLADVQAKLAPPWTRDDGWPVQRPATGTWTNIADRLDPVCGFDAAIAADYRRGGVQQVVDIAVQNTGRWRHGIVKYLRQHATRQTILRALTEG